MRTPSKIDAAFPSLSLNVCCVCCRRELSLSFASVNVAAASLICWSVWETLSLSAPLNCENDCPSELARVAVS